MILKKKTTFISKIKGKAQKRVFKKGKSKNNAATKMIDFEKRADYQVIERVADYNNLLIYSELKNGDLVLFNKLQSLFKVSKVWSNSKQDHLQTIRKTVKLNTLMF